MVGMTYNSICQIFELREVSISSVALCQFEQSPGGVFILRRGKIGL